MSIVMARNEPWISQHISRTTYYRRIKKASSKPDISKHQKLEPWEKARISMATWYRRRRQGF